MFCILSLFAPVRLQIGEPTYRKGFGSVSFTVEGNSTKVLLTGTVEGSTPPVHMTPLPPTPFLCLDTRKGRHDGVPALAAADPSNRVRVRVCGGRLRVPRSRVLRRVLPGL